VSLLLAGIARGGLQFMLVIWLQGVWLPLHGVSFANTPFMAAIDMVPLLAGFLVMGPVSGYLSDKYDQKIFSTAGMLMNVIGFLLLSLLPANFSYLPFALIIFLLGLGQGMFSAPNTTVVMNSVPPEQRGVASGMRATLTNVSFMFSIVIFFTLLIFGFSKSLPATLYSGLIAQNVSKQAALAISRLPPTAALFAAFLGYNPMQVIIPSSVLGALPAANQHVLLGTEFFPSLISPPFMQGMRTVLYAGAVMALIAAIASALKGPRYIHEDVRQEH
jgi:MFS family permease